MAHQSITICPCYLQCQFERGRGWTRGGYTCVCRAGFYPRLKNSTHNGTRVESKLRQLVQMISGQLFANMLIQLTFFLPWRLV